MARLYLKCFRGTGNVMFIFCITLALNLGVIIMSTVTTEGTMHPSNTHNPTQSMKNISKNVDSSSTIQSLNVSDSSTSVGLLDHTSATEEQVLSSITTTEFMASFLPLEPTGTNTTKCVCGISKADDDDEIDLRVVGGSLAKPHSYPWQGILQYYKKHMCSGTVINDLYILTAAHCIFMMKDFQKKIEDKYGSRLPKFTNGSVDLERMTVVLGAHDTADLKNTEIFKVESYLVHPEHSVDEVHDIKDIALLRLSKHVTYTDHIQPVCLPAQGEDFTGRKGVILGWGQTQFNGSNSQYLKHAKVHILPDLTCLESKIGSHFIENPESMICAFEYKTDSCQGDSGGPLLYEHTAGFYIQVGIVSWGIGCAEVGFPGVYTEVSRFTDWIVNNSKETKFCSKP